MGGVVGGGGALTPPVSHCSAKEARNQTDGTTVPRGGRRVVIRGSGR